MFIDQLNHALLLKLLQSQYRVRSFNEKEIKFRAIPHFVRLKSLI